MPSSSGCALARVQRVPAHVRDLQARRRPARCGRPRRGSSRGPRSPRIRGRARPSAACRRRCRGTAGRSGAPSRSAPRPCRGPRRARGGNPRRRRRRAARRGRRSRTVVRVARDDDRLIRARLARGALERLRGRVQVARAVVDDRDGHGRASGCGNSPTIVGRGRPRERRRQRRRRARRRCRSRAVQPSKKRRSASSRSSPTTTPTLAKPRRESFQRRRLGASMPTSSDSSRPTANAGALGDAERVQPERDRRRSAADRRSAPATCGGAASTAARAGTPRNGSRRARTRSARDARARRRRDRRLCAAARAPYRHGILSPPACPWSTEPRRPRADRSRPRRAARAPAP